MPYKFRELMRILTDKRCFVMKEGDRYFFATIVR